MKDGNKMDWLEARETLAQVFSAVGTATQAHSGYFRFQRKIGQSSVTTVAVYSEKIGANAIEVAFNVEAVAAAINHDVSQLRAWVEARRAMTGRDVHENVRYGYKRVGIGTEDELTALLDAWRILTAPVAVADPHPARTTGAFISIPFYAERNGSKTFFAPALRHPRGYVVGRKGDERYISDYWEALAFLTGMASPAFCRPDGNGDQGIVTCQPGDAEDVSLKYLQEQLAKTDNAGGNRG